MPVAIPVFPPPPTGEIPGEFSNEFSAEVDKAHDFWKETVPAFTRQKSNRALKAVGKRHDFSDVGDDFKLPAGSVKKGKRFFKKYCMQCHSIYVDNRVSTGGQITLGPTMWEMAGQPIQMQFRGITDFDIRVDIIHYLQTLNPQDNPEMARPGLGRIHNFLSDGEKKQSYSSGAPKAAWRLNKDE